MLTRRPSPIVPALLGVFVGVAAAPALALALPAPAFSEPAMREDRIEPTIVVTGRGEVQAAPDRVVFNTGVSVQQTTAQGAMRQCAELMQRVIDDVTKAGVPADRVQTAGVNLSPVYEQFRGGEPVREPRIIGYVASNTVRIQLDDIAKLGPLIDSTVKAGANQSFGISFELKNDAEPKRQALTAAVNNARDKAQTIAAALGVSLGDLVEVTESSAQSIFPQRFGRGLENAPAMAMSSTPISPGQVQVEGNVTIRYAIKK